MPIKDPKAKEGDEADGQEYSDDRVAIKMLERRLKAMEMRGTETDRDYGRHGLDKECTALCGKCAATFRNTPFTLGNVLRKTNVPVRGSYWRS